MNFNQFTYTNIDTQQTTNNSQDIKFSIVPNNSYLEDNRILHEFKKHTFGNHTKTEANKNFEQSCLKGEIEKACYWSYQLLASGCINQIWDKCYSIIYKNINIQNPNSPEWILEKEKLFRKMVSKKEFSKDAILFTRNIQQIRNILTELVIFICLSNKRKIDTLSFKFTEKEFDLQVFNEKTPNKHNIGIKNILGPNDSKEVVIASNELYYSIINKNIQGFLYWITWIYQWEKLNIKKYKLFQVQARSIEGISNENQRDVSWLIWSVIQYATKKLSSSMSLSSNLDKQLNSLWLLYIFNWKPGSKTKRLPIMIWYITLALSQFTDFSIPVITNMKLYIKVISNVNLMFQKIKHQERNSPLSSSNSQSLIGNNINIVIEDNYQNQNVIPIKNNITTEMKNEIKSKGKKGNLDNNTKSKLDIMFQLDGYI